MEQQSFPFPLPTGPPSGPPSGPPGRHGPGRVLGGGEKGRGGERVICFLYNYSYLILRFFFLGGMPRSAAVAPDSEQQKVLAKVLFHPHPPADPQKTKSPFPHPLLFILFFYRR